MILCNHQWQGPEIARDTHQFHPGMMHTCSLPAGHTALPFSQAQYHQCGIPDCNAAHSCSVEHVGSTGRVVMGLRPRQWTATHTVECPVCHKKFTERGVSQTSQQDAASNARDAAYGTYENHYRENH